MKIGVTLMMTILLFACSNKDVKAPVNLPHVHSVHLKSFSATEETITFYVALFNSNEFPVAVSSVKANITLNQLHIGKTDVSKKYVLEPSAIKTVIVPISFESEAFQKADQTVLSQSIAVYQLEGSVKTNIGDVPFSTQGNLPVQDIFSAVLR